MKGSELIVSLVIGGFCLSAKLTRYVQAYANFTKEFFQ